MIWKVLSVIGDLLLLLFMLWSFWHGVSIIKREEDPHL